jgi:glutamate--cysteine ligase
MLKQIGEEIGAGYIGIGFPPTWTREDMHWMPKGPFQDHARLHAQEGPARSRHDVARRTVQTNLDFEPEPDMVKKFRVSLALQPLATALFANSPFLEGKAGYKSYRSRI